MRFARSTPRLPCVLVLVAAITAAGCGGDGGSAAETTPARPTLSRAVADDLAGRSDAVADALDAGDVCTAAQRADALLAAVLAAINEGRVPREFQEDLTARANELVNTVNCPPPPAPTTTEEDDDEDDAATDGGNRKNTGKGKGKGRGKGKGNDNGDDDVIVTLPDIP
jgi:hypothetical protein